MVVSDEVGDVSGRTRSPTRRCDDVPDRRAFFDDVPAVDVERRITPPSRRDRTSRGSVSEPVVENSSVGERRVCFHALQNIEDEQIALVGTGRKICHGSVFVPRPRTDRLHRLLRDRKTRAVDFGVRHLATGGAPGQRIRQPLVGRVDAPFQLGAEFGRGLVRTIVEADRPRSRRRLVARPADVGDEIVGSSSAARPAGGNAWLIRASRPGFQRRRVTERMGETTCGGVEAASGVVGATRSWCGETRRRRRRHGDHSLRHTTVQPPHEIR